MKKILGLAAVLAAMILTPVSALAADPAPMAYDWTGAYIGIDAGWAGGNVNQDIPAYAQPVPVGSMSGLVAGGYLGYRAQMSDIVLGIEAGANWRFVEGDNPSGNGGTERLKTTQNWDASLVGKIGLPVNNMLIYGLGGVSTTTFTSQYSGNFNSASASSLGWTVGAGLEAALSDNMSARIEYRYTDYAKTDVRCSTCGPTFVDPSLHSILLGLSYKF